VKKSILSSLRKICENRKTPEKRQQPSIKLSYVTMACWRDRLFGQLLSEVDLWERSVKRVSVFRNYSWDFREQGDHLPRRFKNRAFLDKKKDVGEKCSSLII